MTGAQASPLALSVRFLNAKTAFDYVRLEKSERLICALALIASEETPCAPVLISYNYWRINYVPDWR
jgi:hypothetical protein